MNQRRPGAIIHAVLLLSLLLPEQAFAVSATVSGAVSGDGSDTDTVYRAGVAASRGGDHATALKYFRSARSAGKDSPALTYNIGVTLYRLGDYSASRAEFEQLVDKPAWRDIAHYNLALIAQHQGRRTAATALFQKVVSEAGDARLRQLALGQLENNTTRPAASSSPEAASTVFLNLAAGYDDNVVAFPAQLQQDSSAAADHFSELLVYGERHVTGTHGDGIAVKGYGLARHHADLAPFDSSAYGIGISREQPVGPGNLSWGGQVYRSAVDGHTVTTVLQLDIGWQHRIDSNRYSIRYRPERHHAGTDYPQLDGNRHRLDAEWRRTMGDWHTRAGYRFETNSRNGIETETGNRYDYSPTRQQLRLSAHWPLHGDWQWTAGVMLGQARYDGENRLHDIDGELRIARRESDTVEFIFRSNYRISAQWRAFGEIRDERVDDTFQLYSWDRRILKIGIEFTL